MDTKDEEIARLRKIIATISENWQKGHDGGFAASWNEDDAEPGYWLPAENADRIDGALSGCAMTHDWGCVVPADVPTETVIEIRDGLRSGKITIELPAGVQGNKKAAEWRAEVLSQMLAAYEKEAAQRLC